MCDQKIQTEDIRYPVTLIHRGSMHRSYLQDVDGKLLRDDYGLYLNLYSKHLTDYTKNKRIRFIYNLPKEYRFIITSTEQYNRFKFEIQNGSLLPNKKYCVYYDSDTAPASILRYRKQLQMIKYKKNPN